MWTPYIKDELREIKPDIVVVDFLTSSGFSAADDLNIPVVVNFAGPIDILTLGCGLVLPSRANTSKCCGLICVR